MSVRMWRKGNPHALLVNANWYSNCGKQYGVGGAALLCWPFHIQKLASFQAIGSLPLGCCWHLPGRSRIIMGKEAVPCICTDTVVRPRPIRAQKTTAYVSLIKLVMWPNFTAQLLAKCNLDLCQEEERLHFVAHLTIFTKPGWARHYSDF